MADMRVVVGDPAYYNLLARANARGGLTSSGSNPNLDVGNLCDAVPGTIHEFAAIGTDQSVVADLQELANANFETAFVGQLPTAAWTSASFGAGVTSRDTVTTHGGSLGALKCDVGAGVSLAGVRYTFNVRAGEQFELSGWMRGRDGGVARVQVRNPRTDMRLQSDGSWSRASGIDLFTDSGTDGEYVLKTVKAQVEDYADCRADVVPLILTLYCSTTSGVALFDDWLYTPGFNFVSVHGHNMEPSRLFRVSGSDDGVTYSPIHVGITPRDPSFWAYNVIEYHRYVKLIDLGTPYAEAGQWGEVVLAQAQTATIHPRMGYETPMVRRQVRNQSVGGEVRSHLESLFEERVLRLSFGLAGTKLDELRDEWFKRSAGGHHPMVVAPLDDELDVFHGRIENSLTLRRSFINYREGEVLFTESPFPSVVA